MTHKINSSRGLFSFLFGDSKNPDNYGRPACGAEPGGHGGNTVSGGASIYQAADTSANREAFKRMASDNPANFLEPEDMTKISRAIASALTGAGSDFFWVTTMRSFNNRPYPLRVRAAIHAEFKIRSFWQHRNPNKTPLVIKAWNPVVDTFDIIYVSPDVKRFGTRIWDLLELELRDYGKRYKAMVGDNHFLPMTNRRQFFKVIKALDIELADIKEDDLYV